MGVPVNFKGGSQVKRFRELFSRIGISLFFIAVALSFFNVFLLPFARINYQYSFPGLILSFILFSCFFYWVSLKIRNLSDSRAESLCRFLVPAYCVLMAIIYLAMGHFMEYTPSGDNFMLYNASQVLARQGHFDPGSDFILYFCRFSNQWGFLLLLSLFDKLLFSFGITECFYPLVLFQLLLYELAFITLFSLARRFSSHHGILRLLFILSFCFPLYLAAAVLYTDTFSLPFVLFTFWASLHVLEAKDLKKRILWALLCGLFAFLGGQIKMTVAIILIASALTWFLCLPIKQAAVSLLASLVLFFSGTSWVHFFVLNRYLDKEIYKQENTPIIHWIMMSIPDGDNPYGGFSQDYALTWKMMDEGASHQEVMDSIYSRMKDKIYSLRYPNRLFLAVSRKNAASIGDGTFGMTEMLDDGPVRYNLISKVVLENGPRYSLYLAACSGIWFSVLLSALLHAWANRKRPAPALLLLCVSCLGILLFLMIWEARSRYIFSFVPLFLLLASTDTPFTLREDPS